MSRAPHLRLEHRSTQVLGTLDGRKWCGQTLWALATETGSAGVAWDWVEILDGVVAMADPFGLVTNLQLVDEHGDTLDEVRAAMHLHSVVHTLAWQEQVERTLHGAELRAA